MYTLPHIYLVARGCGAALTNTISGAGRRLGGEFGDGDDKNILCDCVIWLSSKRELQSTIIDNYELDT